MATKTKVSFRAHSGEPLQLDVTGVDGKPYEMHITLSVIEVFDTGQLQPAGPGAVAGTLVPQFEIQASIQASTRPKAS